MRSLSALSLAALTSLSACYVHAAVPPNDRITNATPLSANQTLNRFKSGDITGVTADRLPLLFDNDTSPTTYTYPDVWFRWTAPVSGTLNLQTVAANFVVWGITVLGPAVQDSYKVVGYDNVSTSYGGNAWTTNYSIEVEAGQTYFNGLWCWDIQSPNAYTYVQSFVQDALSDNFASATQLGGTDFTVSGNNGEFTNEDGEPDHSANTTSSSDKSVWTKWRSPDSRKGVVLQATARTFAPIIAVYTGDSLENLKRVARSTTSSSNEGSVGTASFVAEDGVDYYIAIDGSEGKAGAFSLQLKATTARPGFVTQPLATIVQQGETALFTAAAAYTGDSVTYQWERLPAGTKTWEPLADDGIFGGTQSSTLSVLTNLTMNNDRFRVRATDSVGTSPSRAVVLTVTEFPAVSTEVLGTVNTNLNGSTIPEPENGGRYFVTGLPKGLTFDPETGEISGVISPKAKPGVYRVVYGSTNGKKKNPETFVLQIIVSRFAPALTGAFEALLDTPDGQPLPHGKLTLKVANNGNYTGSYLDLTAGKNYPLRGVLELNGVARTAGTPDNAPLQLKRGKAQPPLSLHLTLSEPAVEMENGVSTLAAALFDDEDLVLAQCVDGAPVSRFTAATPAPWAGRYTVRLSNTTLISDGSTPDIPLGSGYAAGTVAPNTGALSLRGRLADNTVLTANLPASPEATYRLGQSLYGRGGSLAGRIKLVQQFAIDLTALSYHSDIGTGSALYWSKPNRPKDKLYPAGFGSGMVRLNTLMEPWTNPAGKFPAALGLAQAGDMKINIVAVLPQDGNSGDNYDLPVDVRINGAGNLSFINPTGNATKFTMKIDPATGVFTGTYQLAEPDAAPKAKPRKVSFSGVMAQRTGIFQGDVIGEGFAIVPPLEAGEVTSAALIEFLAGPPDSPFGISPGF